MGSALNRTRTWSSRRRLSTALAAAGAAGTLILSACSSAASSSATSTPTAAVTADPASSLQGICPSTITIQTAWDPAVGNDYEVYELAAANGTIDTSQKSYTAELIAHGHDTGVKIKILVGGAVVSYQSGGELMRENSSIVLADDGLDTNILGAASTPLVDIFQPQLHNALGVLWDQSSHPGWKSLADIGKSGATILVSNAFLLPWEYLEGKGVIKSAELNKSYKGTPGLFVAAGGSEAQQGYATNEPYLLEHVVTQWMKPVDFQKLSDYGYDPYANAIGTLPQDITTYSACFKKLVPMMQQASLDYLANPTAADALIVKLVKAYNDGFVYSADQAAWAAKALVSSDIVGNSPDGTFGSFDSSSVSGFLTLLEGLAAKYHIAIKPGLKATDLYTNTFIDPSIKMAS